MESTITLQSISGMLFKDIFFANIADSEYFPAHFFDKNFDFFKLNRTPCFIQAKQILIRSGTHHLLLELLRTELVRKTPQVESA